MGLFDEITVEVPLPAGYEDMQDRLFQTKDLDCAMTKYRLDAGGNLWAWPLEIIPDEERATMEPGPLDIPPLIRTSATEIAVDMSGFHGDIEFYDFRIPRDHSTMVTFAARWTEGAFTRVLLVSDEAARPAEEEK
jgi:hypothetical protein